MTLSNQALLEISELSSRAESLARGNASDKAVASVLLGRIANIRQSGLSSDQMRQRYSEALTESVTPPKLSETRYLEAFKKYLKQDLQPGTPEYRDILAGQPTGTISYSQGVAGGFLIPLEFLSQVQTSMAATDPLLDKNITDFMMEDTVTLRPKTVQGVDLSSVSASLVSETVEQTASSFPTIAGGLVLRGNLIYKISIAASVEAQDDLDDLLGKLSQCYGVAFARKLGHDAVLGTGGSQPLGLLTSLPTPSYTTGAGVITLDDILSIYFLVNRFYRAQPKCSWFCDDFTYERIRKAVDSQNRPLLSIEDDKEVLMGRPLHVSPSFGGGGSPIVAGTLAFGDWSHFHARMSRATLSREINSSIKGIEFGEALYVGRCRFDCGYFDPSQGAATPIVTAQITP